MKCPVCKFGISLTGRASADFEAGRITRLEAEKRSLISHARHAHTRYEAALRKLDSNDSFIGFVHPDDRFERLKKFYIEKARIQDHYNDLARKKLGFGKRRHSWEEEATGEARKQRRLEP